MTRNVVIIGGGIAATTCLETLIQEFNPEEPQFKSITLISASRLLKKVINYNLKGRNLESFDITEVDPNVGLGLEVPDDLEVNFIFAHAKLVDSENKTVIFTRDESTEESYSYDILAICIGSSPNDLKVSGSGGLKERQRLITIRDVTSVKTLSLNLSRSRRIVIVGNGGISLELVNTITNCEKVWIIRDKFIGHPFFDSEASRFILDSLDDNNPQDARRGTTHFMSSSIIATETRGPALGPYWLQESDLKGSLQTKGYLKIIYESEIEQILTNENHDWAMTLILSNGDKVDCDLVVSATGVSPNSISTTGGKLDTSKFDGGIVIDEHMRTSLRDVYAAGDVVSCEKWPSNPLWFQMRLWIQARQMGCYCGRCILSRISGTDPSIYFNFDYFIHNTKFLGKKVILLGQYNPQNSDQTENGIEILLRIREKQDYVKLVIKENRIIGAMLVGESGLEETIENLMHDRMDIEPIKYQLLDGTCDLDDYFD